MSELGQWLFAKQRDDMLRALDTRAARTGVAQTVTASQVAVTDPLSGGTETELLTVVGSLPAVGERVLIIPLSDGERVAMRLGVAPSSRLGIDNGNSNIGSVLRLDAGAGLTATMDGADEADLAIDWPALTTPPRGGLGFHVQGGRALYLTTMMPLGTLTGVTLTADRLYYVPVWIPKTANYNGFLFEVTTAVSGSVQIGLYSVGTSFMPDQRELISTKTAVSTLGVKTFSFTSASVQGGRWMFLGICSTVAMAIKGSTTAANLPSFRGGSDTGGSSIFMMANETLTAGWASLPASATSPSSQSNMYLHVGMVAA
jgi:hypothetical protein